MQYADRWVEADKAAEWDQFIRNVERNCLRYVKLLQEAVDEMLDALPLPQVGSGTRSSTATLPRALFLVSS